MDPRDKAREILQSLRGINQHMGYTLTQPLMMAEDAITAALIEARESALEEACEAIGPKGAVYMAASAGIIASFKARIRALKTGGKP